MKFNIPFDDLMGNQQQKTAVTATQTQGQQKADPTAKGVSTGVVAGATIKPDPEKVAAAKTAKTGGQQGASYTANANNQPYVNQLNSLYDQIMNRKPFQYDLNGDLLYRQMADQYAQMGQMAMRDATGTAAGLTGGYGNSYATQVGNQAYQQYLTALNDQIPSLYEQALNAYLNEGNQLLQQYELAAAHPGYLDAINPKTYSVQAVQTDPVKRDNINTYSAALLNGALAGGFNSAKAEEENMYYKLFGQKAR